MSNTRGKSFGPFYGTARVAVRVEHSDRAGHPVINDVNVRLYKAEHGGWGIADVSLPH